MGPILSVRPAVQTLGTSPQPSAGQGHSGGSTAQHGARVTPAAQTESARPVAAATGSGRSMGDVAEQSYLLESARARAEAAHRAYTMASLAAGLNPLNDPVR